MNKEQKLWMRLMLGILNDAGYFTNINMRKGFICVMSHNPDHDTLPSIARHLEEYSDVVEIKRCPDPKVIMVTMNK